MFDRPRTGEKAVLVHLSLQGNASADELDEFVDLVKSAGAEPLGLVTAQRRAPDPRLFVGSGKADDIKREVDVHQAELVIFNNPLSPSQERNLEQQLQCRVLDRTGLILDIFAQRARSHEGKLQVELAQLRHLSTRLVRGWTHLERQKGGIGLRGPGETQLETDRRLVNQRIDQIGRRLAKVDSQRAQSRRARRRNEMPTVSLVGYTNAGKSTLFNRLTEAGVFAKDQLFATLDPTLRRLALPDGNAVVVADTVGFVSRLPHELVAAFRSTLQETVEADLLLHVVDAHSPQHAEQIAEVEAVLQQIDAAGLPRIEVCNKCDLLDDVRPHVDRDAQGRVTRVWLSARRGDGVELLLGALAEHFADALVSGHLAVGPADGRLRAMLYDLGGVLHEYHDPAGGSELEIALKRRDYQRVRKQIPAIEERWIDTRQTVSSAG